MTLPYRQLAFALLTFGSLLYAGMIHWIVFARSDGVRLPLWTWDSVAGGLWYAGSMFLIMLAHEGGHLFMCWRHGMRSSGPYFLPIGFPMIGTFGAFIRVHSPYPDRTALMRVGLAGPVCGFLALLPALIIGLSWSHITDVKAWSNVVRFGKPWMLEQAAEWTVGPGPIHLHPLAIAGWIGLLFTMLNLIPFRQFDGGHIVRAAFGPRVGFWCSVVCMIIAAYLATRSLTWFAVALIMALDWHRIAEPTDAETLPRYRWLYVAVAAILFALSWNQIDIRWHRT